MIYTSGKSAGVLNTMPDVATANLTVRKLIMSITRWTVSHFILYQLEQHSTTLTACMVLRVAISECRQSLQMSIYLKNILFKDINDHWILKGAPLHVKPYARLNYMHYIYLVADIDSRLMWYNCTIIHFVNLAIQWAAFFTTAIQKRFVLFRLYLFAMTK